MSAPKQYRKKPVVITAMAFEGGIESATPILDWIREKGGQAQWRAERPEILAPNGEIAQMFDAEHIRIHTLEGVMRAEVVSHVIRGIEGEFYPCKQSIFDDSYEEADA